MPQTLHFWKKNFRTERKYCERIKFSWGHDDTALWEETESRQSVVESVSSVFKTRPPNANQYKPTNTDTQLKSLAL